MGLAMFTVTGEGGSDDAAFANAKLSDKDAMAGRIMYRFLDSTMFPSVHLAYRRAEDIFGVVPQYTQVSPCGVGQNTVYAVRIAAPPGTFRILFFGLRAT